MNHTRSPHLILLLGLGLATAASAASGAVPAEGTSKGLELFRTRVRTLLVDRCFKCHGHRKTEGKFDITTREAMLKGGKHFKARAVVPFDADKSKMMLSVQKLTKPGMPPKEWLSEREIRDLYVWIANGAPYDGPLTK